MQLQQRCKVRRWSAPTADTFIARRPSSETRHHNEQDAPARWKKGVSSGDAELSTGCPSISPMSRSRCRLGTKSAVEGCPAHADATRHTSNIHPHVTRLTARTYLSVWTSSQQSKWQHTLTSHAGLCGPPQRGASGNCTAKSIAVARPHLSKRDKPNVTNMSHVRTSHLRVDRCESSAPL